MSRIGRRQAALPTVSGEHQAPAFAPRCPHRGPFGRLNPQSEMPDRNARWTATFPHPAHRSNAAPQHYHRERNIHLLSKPDISPDDRWRIPMKTMILAAVAALSLGVGAAYAQGVPAGYQGPHYGTQAKG
jgi:hypothetical protein